MLGLSQLSRKIELRPDGLRYQSPRCEVTIVWQDLIKWRVSGKTTLLDFPLDDLRAALTIEVGPPVR
jgi:hypothetical protein